MLCCYLRQTILSHSNIVRSTPACAFRSTCKLSSQTSNSPFTSTSEKKKIIFLGTPEFAAHSLQILVDHSHLPSSNYEVVAVVCQPPANVGRGLKLTKCHVQQLADKLSIHAYTPESAKDLSFLNDLKFKEPDLCITAAYGNFLPQEFLDIPKYGTLNIHPSLLPLYRGAAPVQRSLENGDSVVGVSVVFTVLKMDAGPIVRQVSRNLRGDEKAGDLLTDLFKLGTHELIDYLPSVFNRTVITCPQDESKVTKAKKLSASESFLNFSMSTASTLHNRVRGFSIWPGSWTNIRIGNSSEVKKIKVITTEVLDEINMSGKHCNEIEIAKRGKVDIMKISCYDGSVLGILEIQPPGKKAMCIKDFANGLRGERVYWVPNPSDDSIAQKQQL